MAPAIRAGGLALGWLVGAVLGWGEVLGEAGDEDAGAEVEDAGTRLDWV